MPTDSPHERTTAPLQHQLWVLSANPIDEVFVRGLTIRNREQPDFVAHLFGSLDGGFMGAIDYQEGAVRIARIITNAVGVPLYVYQINANANFHPLRQSIVDHLNENSFYLHLHEEYRRYLNQLTVLTEIEGPEYVFISNSDTPAEDVLTGIEITPHHELSYSNYRGIRRELLPSTESIQFEPPERTDILLRGNIQLFRPIDEVPFCYCTSVVHQNRNESIRSAGSPLDFPSTGVMQLLLDVII